MKKLPLDEYIANMREHANSVADITSLEVLKLLFDFQEEFNAQSRTIKQQAKTIERLEENQRDMHTLLEQIAKNTTPKVKIVQKNKKDPRL